MTGVELHTVRIILLVVVAVNTLPFATFSTKHIVIDHALVVVLQTALVDRQLFI